MSAGFLQITEAFMHREVQQVDGVHKRAVKKLTKKNVKRFFIIGQGSGKMSKHDYGMRWASSLLLRRPPGSWS
jgi:hypothetical protein